eukprot:3855209-Rhodomonas_salina.1
MLSSPRFKPRCRSLIDFRVGSNCEVKVATKNVIADDLKRLISDVKRTIASACPSKFDIEEERMWHPLEKNVAPTEIGALNRSPAIQHLYRRDHNRTVGHWTHQEAHRMEVSKLLESAVSVDMLERYAAVGLPADVLEHHIARRCHNSAMGVELMDEAEYDPREARQRPQRGMDLDFGLQ